LRRYSITSATDQQYVGKFDLSACSGAEGAGRSKSR
jgi:hypothetical protein